MKTVEDAKKWVQENDAKLDADRLACEDKTVKMLNEIMPAVSKLLWDTGNWMQEVLREVGATEDQIYDILFAHGQRSFAADPFQVAVAFVNEYIETGDTVEKPGLELADKICDEILRN